MIKNFLKYITKMFGYNISRYDILFLIKLKEKKLKNIIELRNRFSQLNQDLFVLSQLNYKKNGYFVEFGAMDGILYSNTYLLEKKFSWKGILAEPIKSYSPILKQNRKSIIETDCVWSKSNQFVEFNEVESKELSTVSYFNSCDNHADARKKGVTYSVRTISLSDLLEKNSAPKIIDYLSIDTEGSEYEILKEFDFSKFRFRVITCEHNYTDSRDKLLLLLEKNGYKRLYTNISRFDDWYIDTTLK